MSFILNGDRLRDARRYRQFTISALADKIGVSKQMVSKYEHGIADPGVEVFQKIVKSLNFPLDFFTSNDKFQYQENGTFFRSRLTATQTEKTPSEMYKKAAGIVRNYFGTYVEFPKLYSDSLKSVSPRDAAIELRNTWGLGNNAIPNMMRLLESHGLIVSVIDSGSGKVDAHSGYVSINGARYYLVHLDHNSHSFYRQQFNLAHELGHFILHADMIDPQDLDSLEYRQIEKEADEFASEFLLPAEPFSTSILNEKMNLDWYLRLKGVWFVAASAMVYRARDLKILDADEYVRLQKRMSYRKWRKSEPFDDSVEPKKPEMLKQSLELLSNSNIIEPSMLSTELEKRYGIDFPNEMLAQVIGVSVNKFNGKIVKLRRND